MYKKQDRDQLYLENFFMPFGGKLCADNRWVKLAEIMPWDFIEDVYMENICEEKGAGSISSRIAFGSLYIKENENLVDRSTVKYIAENPYMQYFLGLHEFRDQPLFDPSLMVHFRKRFPADKIEEINRLIVAAIKKDDQDDDDNPRGGDNDNDNSTNNEEKPDKQPKNKGKLVLDATCAPADIRYPSDLSLLNEARENTEEIIEELWEHSKKQGHKTKYNRRKARSKYLKIAKQKKAKAKSLHKAIGEQLDYVTSNIEKIGNLLLQTRHLCKKGHDVLEEKRYTRIMTICELIRQQKFMLEHKTKRIENRIVSLRQPHIRPIGLPFPVLVILIVGCFSSSSLIFISSS